MKGRPSSCCTGVLAAACTQGKRTQHGKPQGVISDDQPDAREGQAGRLGVAERFAVPLKPGKRRGGKGGPQLFKTDAKSGQAVSIDLARRVATAMVMVPVAQTGRATEAGAARSYISGGRSPISRGRC